MDYAKAQVESLSRGENNDCAVKAVAIVTGHDYATVHALMGLLGRRSRRETPLGIIFQAFECLGFKLEPVDINARSVRTLERKVKPYLTYLCATRRHILAVKNGKVQDWTAGRTHRITDLWIVVKEQKDGESKTESDGIVSGGGMVTEAPF